MAGSQKKERLQSIANGLSNAPVSTPPSSVDLTSCRKVDRPVDMPPEPEVDAEFKYEIFVSSTSKASYIEHYQGRRRSGGNTKWHATHPKLEHHVEMARNILADLRASNHKRAYATLEDLEEFKNRLAAFKMPKAPGDLTDTQVEEDELLRQLAVEGEALFNIVFREGCSPLRKPLRSAPFGTELWIHWPRGEKWMYPNFPWQLLYLGDASKAPDPTKFFGYWFQLHVLVKDEDYSEVNSGYSLHPLRLKVFYCCKKTGKKDLCKEAAQQKALYKTLPRSRCLPTEEDAHTVKSREVVDAIRDDIGDPLGLIYFYCEAHFTRNSEWYFKLNDKHGTYGSRDWNYNKFQGMPFVFANACRTNESLVSQSESPIESYFYQRGVRSYLGVLEYIEPRVACRFAIAFFEFLYNREYTIADSLRAARLLLLGSYGCLGGLYYQQVNDSEVTWQPRTNPSEKNDKRLVHLQHASRGLRRPTDEKSCDNASDDKRSPK